LSILRRAAVSHSPSGRRRGLPLLLGALAALLLGAPAYADVPPTNDATDRPVIEGDQQDGQVLRAHRGTWTGTSPIDFTYRWQRLDPVTGAWNDVPLATSETYSLTPDDVGTSLRVVVTAANSTGSASEPSEPTGSVKPAPPVSDPSRPASITGSAKDGEDVVADPGGFSGTPPLTLSYQWRRCARDGSCSEIPGATDQRYHLSSAEVGTTVDVVVTATNSAGSASSTAAPSDEVQALTPANTATPNITGTAKENSTLTASPGAWSGSTPLTHTYQWQRCDALGASCLDIAGATGKTYKAAALDIDATLRVRVTADNGGLPGGASAAATSNATPVVTVGAPTSTASPTISGTTTDGQLLTATNGSWASSREISGLTYQWRRCDNTGAGCVSITGATQASYRLTSADVNRSVRVRVIATNAGGSTTAASAPTATVQAIPAANTAPPTVSGATVDGQKLTGTRGSFTGSTPLTYTYQWRRCDPSGANCTDIPNATFSVYSLVSKDVGSTLRLKVTASNSSLPGGGKSSSTSEPTALVRSVPATNTAPPTITGTAQDSRQLTVAKGTWSGSTPISFSYQWQRCDAAGASCVDVSGATASTFTLKTGDIGLTMRARVTGSNGDLPGGGSASAVSEATAIVQALPPANTGPPTISGKAQDGQTLSGLNGSWTGSSPRTFAYRWERCDTSGEGCVDIAGATAKTRTLNPADVGRTLRLRVTVSNASLPGGGSASAVSESTPVVAPLSDPVVAAAGDIACDPASPSFNGGLGTSSACRQKHTSDLLGKEGLAAVLPLGDEQYECGGYNAFLDSYDPSWGRLKSISRPVVGDEEHLASGGTDCDSTGQAAGYYKYFGPTGGDPSKGYYSFDVGSWHIVALNTNDSCSKVACGAGSAQEQWLKADLAAHPASCTLAYWHAPRFASGQTSRKYEALWDALSAAGAEVVLNGHVHAYERFAPQTPDGGHDPDAGIREFIVGTGGKRLSSPPATVAPNSEVRNYSTFGVLALTLHDGSYDWRFIPEEGKSFRDSGSASCR
ncbi:MAG: hypothetical protein LC808_25395, partial [Actinobacteria bacterium]|nr:hypothetical protein [Actinomycetota bacterium]